MTRINQYRTNPSQAISNFKGRWDSIFGWPSTAISTWLNGGLFGASYATVASHTGTLRDAGDFKYYYFDATGTLTTDKGGLADVLIVGGGGGGGKGGTSRYTGGGGAGGFRLIEGITLVAGQENAITVGAGGASGTAATGLAGGFSRFDTPAGLDFYAGGGGGGGGSTNGGASGVYAGTTGHGGAGGGGYALQSYYGGTTGSGGAGGDYGAEGAAGYAHGSNNSASGGHGGGRYGDSPTGGLGACSLGTVRGSYNDWRTGSDLSYACGGSAVTVDSGSSNTNGYAQSDWTKDGTESGRIAGGKGHYNGTSADRTATANTGGGGGGCYNGTGGTGGSGIVILKLG